MADTLMEVADIDASLDLPGPDGVSDIDTEFSDGEEDSGPPTPPEDLSEEADEDEDLAEEPENPLRDIDINGISWVPESRTLYIAYEHCIQEYYLSYGVPSLKELCVDKVVALKDLWSRYGWSIEQMPWTVTERL